MPDQHLAEVHHIEERANAHRVERVLAVGCDPLRVKVLLGYIAGEALHDRGKKGDHSGDPGHRAPPAPGRHPELPPQVDHQQRHEQLDAPQVRAIEEMADRVVVPPVGPADGEGETRDDRQAQRDQRCHAEHVDPGGHVRGLPIGQQLLRRQQPGSRCPHLGGPHILVARLGSRRDDGRVGASLIAVSGACRSGEVSARVEGDQQGSAKDDDHHRDHNQVRDGDIKDAPAKELARLIQIAGQWNHVRKRERNHVGSLNQLAGLCLVPLLTQIRRAVNEYHQSVVMVTHDPRVAAYADSEPLLAGGHSLTWPGFADPAARRIRERARHGTRRRVACPRR